MGLRSAAYSQNQPGGYYSVAEVEKHPNEVFFVHSGTGVDGAGYGRNPDAPVATIDYAIGLCTASKGDVIYVMPGHNEGLGAAQIAVDVAGISIIGLGKGSLTPRIDFDNAAASIDVSASGCTIKNLRLLPSVTDVLIGIDVNANVTDTLIEDVEALPGEDGAGVDDFALTVDIKAGCTRTTVRRLKVLSHGTAAGYIAGVKLTGASNDVLIEDCYINIVGAGVVAPINADTTLSTNLRIKGCLLVTDAEPGIEVITGTTGVCQDNDIFTDLATIAAAITGNGGASGMAQFRNEYVEVAPERGALVGTASIDD
jgi:hypothetical protein